MMGSLRIKWLQPLFLLATAATLARPSRSHLVYSYPGNPSYVQTHGLVSVAAPPTAYATQTIGVPVLSSQSTFFLRSVPPLVTPGVRSVVTPTVPGVITSSVPGLTASPVPATPIVPLPAPPSPAVPAYLVYSNGAVVPLSDSHYKLPPVIEGIVNRVQNYFSNYAQVDPHLLPFPAQNQQNTPKVQKLTNADNSTAAITTTTTTTTTARTFGNAINLRLLAAPGQNPGNVAFARTSTVPTSSGRTAKLIEVFRPPSNGNNQFLGSLVRSAAEDNGRIPLAVATATATVNLDGDGNIIPSNQNRPPAEFVPEGSNTVTSQTPSFPPNGDGPQEGIDSSRPPSDTRPRPPVDNRPRPEKPPVRPRPDPSPPKGYRYDKPLRPLEYDIPPKPQAYQSYGNF